MAYTDIDDPSAYFQIATYTGSNNQSITNDGNSDLQPDFVWIKRRSNADHHSLTNSSLGVNKQLLSSSSNAEQSRTDQIQSFNTDGFTLGIDGAGYTNVGGNTYVAWQWKANGGTTSSNTDGSITSTVQVNQDAGFSIVTWTGNENASATVGHGLGVAPDMWIAKRRNGTYNWQVYTSALAPVSGNNLILTLNSTAAAEQVTGTSFTSSSTFQPSSNAKRNSGDMIAYCFASKQGYSKFGSYIGTGFANGPFVYTGFKPAFLIVKNTTNSGYNWVISDHKRSPVNEVDKYLWGDLTDAEYDGSGISLDIDYLSNGFKLRTSRSETNLNTATYIYMAFAENPFVTSTGVPTTAR